jgi:hypothetical protein
MLQYPRLWSRQENMKVALALATTLLAVNPAKGARSKKPVATTYKITSKSFQIDFTGAKDIDACSDFTISVSVTDNLNKEGGTRTPVSLATFGFSQRNICDNSLLEMYAMEQDLNAQLTGTLKGAQFTIEGTGLGRDCPPCDILDPGPDDCPCAWFEGRRFSLTGTLTPTASTSIANEVSRDSYPDGTRVYSRVHGTGVFAAVTFALSVEDVTLGSDLDGAYFPYGPPRIRQLTSGVMMTYK